MREKWIQGENNFSIPYIIESLKTWKILVLRIVWYSENVYRLWDQDFFSFFLFVRKWKVAEFYFRIKISLYVRGRHDIPQRISVSLSSSSSSSSSQSAGEILRLSRLQCFKERWKSSFCKDFQRVGKWERARRKWKQHSSCL